MKKFYIAMMAMLLSGSAIAAPVDATSAKEKASAFLKKQAQHSTNSRRAAALRNPQLTEAQAFGNALHVFNVGQDNGFVIVSGDDRTNEILGYVESGTFDINNIPDNMRFWLQAVSDGINSGNIAKKAPRRETKNNIESFVTTHWDQVHPFNSRLISDLDERTQSYYRSSTGECTLFTGCVATAMAQVVFNAAKNYKANPIHNSWPTEPTTLIPSYVVTNNPPVSLTGQTMPALDPTTFDWDNLVNDYSPLIYQATDDEKYAVGELMKYCGRAVVMDYDKTVSGARVIDVPKGLHDYLGLSKFAQSVDRAYYNSQEWEDLLYKELQNNRAILYGAGVGTESNSSNHCFVLDGYKDGLFHVNWGWAMSIYDQFSGRPLADGYFDLCVLQPMASGSGGAEEAQAQYKYNQQAVINISYDDPEDTPLALNFYWKSKSAVYTSSISYSAFGTYNVFGATMNFDGGWAIRNADGTLEFLHQDYENVEFGSIQVKDGITSYMSDLGIASKADGDYDLIHVSRESGTQTWYPDYGSDKQYITATVSDGRVTNVVVHPVNPDNSQFSVQDVQLIGTMEANKENTVRVTINNTGDDYFGNVALYYSTTDNIESTKNVIQLGTVKPGESTHDFTVKLPTGEYNLWVFVNPSSYPNASQAIGSGYKMYIGMGNLNQVTVDNFQVEGQQDADPILVKSVNGILDEIKGSFDVKNDMTTTYSNIYYVAVEKGTGSSKTQYKKVRVDVAAPANTTTPFEFTISDVAGLQSGETYKLRLFSEVDRIEVDVTSKSMQLDSWFRYWEANGNDALAKESATLDATVQVNALAIDYRNITTQKKADNINCIYYLSAANTSLGQNTVVNGTANNMIIDANNPFFVPEEFTANEISYTRKFVNGNNDDGKGWETIVLPFTVNNVKQGTKNLKWFKSASDKRCNFWVMELIANNGTTLTFDYASEFLANKPYIIAVPGDKWGEKWLLAGKEITFYGKGVIVPVSNPETVNCFVGTFYPLEVTGAYTINTNGDKFEQATGTIAAYTAYLNETAEANALHIVILGDEDIATGIMDLSAEPAAKTAIYNINGVRVNSPQKGLYIQNGKVVVIK